MAKVNMTWTVNIRSSVPVYKQIENLVLFALAAGKAKPKDQLPSVREMSQSLKVNPNTVAKAYRDLEVMGYLYTRRGMGVYIAEGGPVKAKKQMAEYVKTRLGEIAREAGACGLAVDPLLKTFRDNMKTKGKPIYV